MVLAPHRFNGGLGAFRCFLLRLAQKVSFAVNSHPYDGSSARILRFRDRRLVPVQRCADRIYRPGQPMAERLDRVVQRPGPRRALNGQLFDPYSKRRSSSRTGGRTTTPAGSTGPCGCSHPPPTLKPRRPLGHRHHSTTGLTTGTPSRGFHPGCPVRLVALLGRADHAYALAQRILVSDIPTEIDRARGVDSISTIVLDSISADRQPW